MSFRPLSDRVLIKKIDPAKLSEGGIHIPDNADNRDQTIQGRVLAVGPGRHDDNGDRIEPGVDEGDIVIYPKYGGSEVKIDGEGDCVIVSAREILGVVHD